MTTYTGDFGELVIETDLIDVTSALPYADDAWRFTDAAGHEHYRADGGYPTLRNVVDSRETYWCEDCGEEHEDVRAHDECLICGEVIVPGSKVDTHRRYQPGRTAYVLNGRPISEEQAKRLVEERRQS